MGHLKSTWKSGAWSASASPWPNRSREEDMDTLGSLGI